MPYSGKGVSPTSVVQRGGVDQLGVRLEVLAEQLVAAQLRADRHAPPRTRLRYQGPELRPCGP